MKFTLSKACLFGAFLPLLLATHAHGALILWDATPTNVNISDPTQVFKTGTLVVAEFMSTNSAATVDINGVHFVDWQVAANVSNALSNNAVFITPTNAYETLLSGGTYLVNSGTPPATVLSNLTIGQSYQIEVWTPYWNNSSFSTRFSSSAPDGASSAMAPNQSATLQLGNGTGGVAGTPSPQFIMGTFTADATSQNLYYFGDASVGIIGALELRSVPEPTTITLLSLGGLALLVRRRFRSSVSL